MMEQIAFDPTISMLSGYHPLDGTIEFFGRIRSVLKSTDCVVDLGAGRGSWFYDETCEARRSIRNIKPLVASYIGLDVDPIVLDNPTTTDNKLIENGKLPLPDNSVDVIIADWVLEHIQDPDSFTAEINRVLKKGGYFFARTPFKYSYISISAKLIHNKFHDFILKKAQPTRKSEDEFDTHFKLNTHSAIRKYFIGFKNYSYFYTSTPSYYFNNRTIYILMTTAHKTLPEPLVSSLYIFLKKTNHQHE